MKIKGKMAHSSRMWLNRQLRDPFVKQAAKDGYNSRAAYKLLEIDDKFRLIQNSLNIIDLGAAPGGWSQVLSQRASKNTKIAAIDLLEFKKIDNVCAFVGDFNDTSLQNEMMNFLGSKANLIVSDMAPSTIGHRQSDHLRIMELVENAYEFSLENLHKGGSFIVKIFQGGEEADLFKTMKKDFKQAKFFKPKSSRKDSSEIYMVAIGYK